MGLGAGETRAFCGREFFDGYSILTDLSKRDFVSGIGEKNVCTTSKPESSCNAKGRKNVEMISTCAF